jgi:hypothetical protein
MEQEDIAGLVAELRRGVPTRDSGYGVGWELDDDAANRLMDRAATALARPHVLMRPKLYPDGNMWCALYGEDLVTGCAGFGPTPAEAMADFDANWADMQASAEPSIKSRLMGEFDRVILALKEAPNGAA